MNINKILVTAYQKVKTEYPDFPESDYRNSFKTFSAWMHDTLKASAISNEISSMFFGVSEADGAVKLTLSGAIVSGRRAPNWINEANYKKKTAPDFAVSEFFAAKLSAGKDKALNAMVTVAASYVKAYTGSYPQSDLNRKAKHKENKKQTKLHVFVGTDAVNMVKVR